MAKHNRFSGLKQIIQPFEGDSFSLDGLEEESSVNPQNGKGQATAKLEEIQPGKAQPRRYFDPEKLDQLATSIKEHGILEPLLIRQLDDGKFELIAGERRYRAAKIAGLSEVPVIVRNFSDSEARQIALIENLQREDLNPVEETEGILDLLSLTLSKSRAEVISILNKAANEAKKGETATNNVIRSEDWEKISQVFNSIGTITPDSFRSNRLPLLNLPENLLDALGEGKIEFTKARAIAKVKDESDRAQLLEEAIADSLPLSAIRKRIKDLSQSESQQSAGESFEGDGSVSRGDRMRTLLGQVENLSNLSERKRRKLDKLLTEIEKLLST